MKIINNKKVKLLRKKLRNNMPKPEQKLWYYLRRKQLCDTKFRRQVSIGKYIVDFYAPTEKLIIEIDGDSHFESDIAISKDKERTAYLEDLGFEILRFSNNDIMNNIESCIEKIEKLFRMTID